MGFTNLTGVDYSESAIKLSQEISDERESEAVFKVMDLLDPSQITQTYDVILDKGTFDAISLSPVHDESSEGVRDEEAMKKYVQNVHSMLQKPNGILLITSCNWTESELVTLFKDYFVFKSRSSGKYSAFSFGGQTGSTVCTIAFAPLNQVNN